jgi:hypothetical protein
MKERAQHQAECDAIAAAGDAQLVAVAAANKAAAEQQAITANSMAALQAELAAAKRDAQVSVTACTCSSAHWNELIKLLH